MGNERFRPSKMPVAVLYYFVDLPKTRESKKSKHPRIRLQIEACDIFGWHFAERGWNRKPYALAIIFSADGP
jgi:hypothetical protein